MRQKRPGQLESTAASILTLKLFQAMAGLVLFAGLVLRQREIILLSALALATINTARLWCWYGTRRLGFRAAVGRDRLYPGEEYDLEVRVENRQLLPIWVHAVIPDNGAAALPKEHGEGEPGSGSGGSGAGVEEERKPLLEGEIGLLAFQQVHWRRTLRVAARGVYRLGPIRQEGGDLLGFFRRREKSPVPLEVLVYPRLVPLAPLPLPAREFFGLQKARTPVEDPVFHAGTRDYHGSRPARHIHWKASARLDRLQEKLYEPTSQASILFLLDAASFSRAYGPDGEEPFERTLEVVGSLAVELERARVPVGLAVNGVRIGGASPVLAPGRGPYQVARILEVLARLTFRPDRAVDGFTGGSLRVTGSTTCLYVCRRLAGPGARTVRALRYRLQVPVVVLLAEPLAVDPAAAGLPVVRLADLRAAAPGPGEADRG